MTSSPSLPPPDASAATLALVAAVRALDPAGVREALMRGGNPNATIDVPTRWPQPLLTHIVRERGHAQLATTAHHGPGAQQDRLTIAQALLRAGANPAQRMAQDGETVWHVALVHQDNDAVRALLEVSTEGIDTVRHDGATPLLALAADRNGTTTFPPAAARLLRAGADPSIAWSRGSVLQTAMTRCHVRKGHLHDSRNLMAWTRALVDAGLDLHITNNLGATAMHWMAFAGRLDLAQVLWATPNSSALMNARNGNGHTPWALLKPRHQAAWRDAWQAHERRLLLGDVDLQAMEHAPPARTPRRL